MTDRLLVVEDDEGHRLTLDSHLRCEGYDVLAVESAQRALTQFVPFRPDVVLCDIRMPGMSGLELLHKLRESKEIVPVIFTTAYGDVRTTIEALKQGAYDYLVKPLDIEELDQVLVRCLRARRRQRAQQLPAVDELPEGGDWMLVGNDQRMIRIYKLIAAVSETRVPVVIRGETGTGKEVVARLIHQNSAVPDQPFVPVNCAALPDTLLEAELFGHTRGAFTGAIGARKGRFEMAGRGTIFLDEIGDVSQAFQGKLLRVLEDGEFQPLGSEQPRTMEARVIAATHRSLEAMVARGEFRQDLYFRLRVVEIAIPPLRERRSDVPLLVQELLRRACRQVQRDAPAVPDDVMTMLVDYDWPGNVRELQNVLTRAVVLARDEIGPEHLLLGSNPSSATHGRNSSSATIPVQEDEPLASLEYRYAGWVLARAGGHKTEAARILGISRPRLNRLLKKQPNLS